MFGTLRWLSNIGLSREASDLFIVIYNLFHDMFDQYNFVLKAVFMKWKFTTVMRSFVLFADIFDLNAISTKLVSEVQIHSNFSLNWTFIHF